MNTELGIGATNLEDEGLLTAQLDDDRSGVGGALAATRSTRLPCPSAMRSNP